MLTINEEEIFERMASKFNIDCLLDVQIDLMRQFLQKKHVYFSAPTGLIYLWYTIMLFRFRLII